MLHEFIPETKAAALLGYDANPRTLRYKVTGTGPYAGKERLPITFTLGGKSYQYSLQDIQKHLRQTASR